MTHDNCNAESEWAKLRKEALKLEKVAECPKCERSCRVEKHHKHDVASRPYD